MCVCLRYLCTCVHVCVYTYVPNGNKRSSKSPVIINFVVSRYRLKPGEKDSVLKFFGS